MRVCFCVLVLRQVVLLGVFGLVLVLTVLIERIFGWRVLLQAIVAREPLARRLVRFLITSDWSRALASTQPPPNQTRTSLPQAPTPGLASSVSPE